MSSNPSGRGWVNASRPWGWRWEGAPRGPRFKSGENLPDVRIVLRRQLSWKWAPSVGIHEIHVAPNMGIGTGQCDRTQSGTMNHPAARPSDGFKRPYPRLGICWLSRWSHTWPKGGGWWKWPHGLTFGRRGPGGIHGRCRVNRHSKNDGPLTGGSGRVVGLGIQRLGSASPNVRRGAWEDNDSLSDPCIKTDMPIIPRLRLRHRRVAVKRMRQPVPNPVRDAPRDLGSQYFTCPTRSRWSRYRRHLHRQRYRLRTHTTQHTNVDRRWPRKRAVPHESTC